MSKKSSEEQKADFPGLTLKQFSAAAGAIVELRDSGKLLVFFARRGSVRIIGDLDGFRNAWSDRSGQENISEKQARNTLNEVQQFVSLCATYGSTTSARETLERFQYDELFERLDDEGKATFREQLDKKMKIASETFFSKALDARVRRLKTATGASLEDVDVEVVRERHDGQSESTVKDSFLRLRLRYSRGDEPVFPFFVLPGFGPPTPTASFELECDESDIDLLILRLTSAKNRLLDSRQEPTSISITE